ncbi:MAG: patatin-like phospholipase family protein [Halanaerobiales bacterium]
MNAELSEITIDNDTYLIENYESFKAIKSPKLALALSGGGARGFVNIGVIKALNEAGIYPDIVIGSSMGGIIGTLYGSGLSGDDVEDITTNLPYDSLLDINLIPVYSLFQTDKFNYILETVSHQKKMENFPVKTGLLNFDLDSGNMFVTSEGSISEVLQSTYSIPFYYPINKSKERYLVDPGLIEMVPAKAAKALSADIIISTTAFDELPYETYKYPIQSLSRMLLLVQKKNSEPILNKYSDIVIRNEVSDYSFKDFDLIEEFIAIGYKNTKEKIPEIKELLKNKNYQSSKPQFYEYKKNYNEKLYTDILFDRMIYPDTYFNYLLYYFNNQSFFEQELFRNIVYDLHYGVYFEKSHFKLKTLFDVGNDKHTELMMRYKKLLEPVDYIIRIKNNPAYNNIDYITEFKFFIQNSSFSLGIANLRQENYYYLNNNIKLERGKIKFENNTDLLLNKNKNPQFINSSLLDYNIDNRWKNSNKFVFSNTDLLGNPNIYRGKADNNKEKTSLSTSLIYRYPFSKSTEFMHFFSLEQFNPSIFLDINFEDDLNAAAGINLNMISSLMGLKPLNIDTSAAYDKDSKEVIYNFSFNLNY